MDAGVKTILLHKENSEASEYAIIHNTLQKDPTNSEKEAVEHIYRQLRNAEPPDEETARGIIDKLFFSETRYSLGEVGRYRINKKLNLDLGLDEATLTKVDIILIIKFDQLSDYTGMVMSGAVGGAVADWKTVQLYTSGDMMSATETYRASKGTYSPPPNS